MYVIRRAYKVKPRAAREAATLAAEIGRLYKEAGRRSEVTVYFNGTTLPGERDVVYMQWTDEVLQSPYGRGEPSIPGASELGARLRELTEDQWIEFYELLTPEKAVDLS
ncbi:MAG: hypothetical protein DWQ40_07575 [Actinobacteria bacterium]|nr:MAG: hypothetical protein DWQ40_07575 [Actinomycetota bacterium]